MRWTLERGTRSSKEGTLTDGKDCTRRPGKTKESSILVVLVLLIKILTCCRQVGEENCLKRNEALASEAGSEDPELFSHFVWYLPTLLCGMCSCSSTMRKVFSSALCSQPTKPK